MSTAEEHRRMFPEHLASLSATFDAHLTAQGLTGKALLWERVAKCAAEAGEVIEATHRLNGGNPRKPATTHDDVLTELLDVAVAALAAVEHLTGNNGASPTLLHAHTARVAARFQPHDH